MTNTQPYLPLGGEPKVITGNFGKPKPEPREPELVEGEGLKFLFLNGMRPEATPDVVTFTGWVLLFDERQMVVHFTSPRSVAVELHKALGEQLSEERAGQV